MVHGGFSGDDERFDELKSLEVISSSLAVSLPDSPEAMGGHSLAAVGSTVYSCGSCTPWNITSVKRNCYKIDISKKGAQWISSTPLPKKMSNYHTAITVKDFIWYFTYNSSSVFMFNPESSNFTEHGLPFTYTKHGCFASLDDSVFYIDSVKGLIYTLLDLNKPESWSKTLVAVEQRFFPACLLIGNDLVITGGDGSVQAEYFQSINTKSFVSKHISNFVHDRIGYNIFILDGRPAVAGGLNKEVLDSIESYNFVTDEWSVIPWKLETGRAYYALAQLNLTV